ncbi:DUF1405 domain-containing protein [Aciduricibacillus chroicocephali]|uniref:DUF1405 domain-containing protein n=1 Tax=Aciduricibacillus chroicocephali TaxID=3054939 RepID=A0ABY9KRJ0_9BACI|nr:DUF1405 domain-containing protein [Bacillaceae bacterium 44XB]
MNLLKDFLFHRTVIWLLFWVNLAGTFYGFWWYRYQLAETPLIFQLFVPDSPTASLFITLVLLAFLYGRSIPYIEALAVVSLFKYGVWAVVMNMLMLIQQGSLGWQGYMLMISHGAMAVEAVLFAAFYTYRLKHLVVGAIWVLHNDIIDYVFGMMPIYGSLMIHINEIGYFTFWLSTLSIAVGWKLCRKREKLDAIS